MRGLIESTLAITSNMPLEPPEMGHLAAGFSASCLLDVLGLLFGQEVHDQWLEQIRREHPTLRVMEASARAGHDLELHHRGYKITVHRENQEAKDG